MSSEDGSKSPSFKVLLYMWGGSQLYKKRFVANLHRVITEAQFQKWPAAYASAIPNNVHVKLVKPLTDDMPCVDANDLDARIITFGPFYFSLGFTFPLSNLSRIFKLDMTVREFFYFFEVRHYEKYAQVRICHAKMFNNLSQGDHVWHDDVFEVSGWWEGDVSNGLLVPITYCNVNDICKKLELGPDMARAGQALNISLEVLRVALVVERVSRGSRFDVKSSRDEAASSQKKNVSSLRKKQPKLPSTEKTQVGIVPLSSTRVKHLVCADSKKIGCTRNPQDVPLNPPADKLGDRDLLHKMVHERSSSIVERQRDVDIPLRSLGRLHQSKDGGEVGAVKKVRESSVRAKGSSTISAADPKMDKSSPEGDACVSDLLKMNFLSSLSACFKLVDHIHKASDLDTFSSLSLEKQREATFHLLQKGVSSLAEKDSELNSFATDLVSRKDAYFRLEHKNADISLSYDKLLARFPTIIDA
ncbi:unnamed protein product [Prunus armeniaca]